MSDLKDFWELAGLSGLTRGDLFPQVRIDLGMMYWKRGGKQFVEQAINSLGEERLDEVVIRVMDYIDDNSTGIIENYDHYEDGGAALKDYRDCLACLGEDKVKELIKREVKTK